MTFFVDEDVTERLPPLLRALGHDAVDVREVGRKGRSDPQQLAFAAERGSVIVTCNDRDFVALHETWLLCPIGQGGDRSRSRAGIAIVPNGSQIVDADLVSTLDHFARQVEAPAGRLHRWRRDVGWQKIELL